MKDSILLENKNVYLVPGDGKENRLIYQGGDAVKVELLTDLSRKIIVWTENGEIKLVNEKGEVEFLI